MFSDDPNISEYDFKGLKGRMGHWPAKNTDATRTFVIIYGQHATIERLLPMIGALQNFGDVYIADNPGFGGMDPASKINNYPDLEFYADHLNHFITTHIPDDRTITLLGISFGFQMVTELLSTYPKLTPRVEEVISLVGFVSHKDFSMKKTVEIPLMYGLCNIGRTRLGAKILDALFLNNFFIPVVYKLTKPLNETLKDKNKEETNEYVRESAWLWVVNDTYTHGATAWDFFKTTDLSGYKLPVKGKYLSAPSDHLLNTEQIKASMRTMFKDFESHDLNVHGHAPLDIETEDHVLDILPQAIKDQFESSTNKTAVTD
ncbi:TPA: alpha/beta fold hydrolase [Candidatus Saccharibacteria bacterium]|nr:alpha/beta fold hydrolase [Candidatus Saccharibacteria bacterium]HIO87303.1 alpha/beta fold hydrolase [Candidatus Saccharibacteria bacterium]